MPDEVIMGNENKPRILQVNIENRCGNGAFSVVYNLYQCLCKDFIFDFFSMDSFTESDEKNFIESQGGHCYSADLRKNRVTGHISLYYKFKDAVKKSQCHIVHIHSEVAYKHLIYALAAKRAGVKRIIIHSHSSNIDGSFFWLKYILHKAARPVVNWLGTDFVACSGKAAEWMFKKDIIRKKKFVLLSNGICYEKYLYCAETRESIRAKLNYTGDNIVLGHVGALKKVKNQGFLLDIIEKIIKKDKRYRLLLIGDGDDREQLEKQIAQKGISDYVNMYGASNNVPELLHSIDIFVFPSIFEGVPMSLIECQCMGIPVLASDTINDEIKINDNVCFFDLEKGAEIWAEKLLNMSKHRCPAEGYERIKESQFNIRGSADKLKELYFLEN